MGEKFYDPDLELIPSKTNHYGNTDYGHNLAEKIMKKREAKNSEKENKKTIETLTKYPAKVIFNSSKQRQLLKGILGELNENIRKAINYSPDMETSDMWNAYNEARKGMGLI